MVSQLFTIKIAYIVSVSSNKCFPPLLQLNVVSSKINLSVWMDIPYNPLHAFSYTSVAASAL